jgi:prepilin signal peptidase PulO-like enzyme (type II secretory pathway)
VLFLTLFFLLGLLFGSFFNVAGLRIPKKQSIITPPSHCPACRTRLTPRELIPVVSYLVNRGKCRTCKAVISPIYPVMELVTGLSFSLVYDAYEFSPETLMGLLFASLLVIITVSDLTYRLIPDRVIVPFLVLFLLLRLFIHPDYSYGNHLIGMAVGFGLFLLLAVLSRGGVGGGDIKLYAVVGLFLGTPLLVLSVLLSTLSGTVYGVLLMLTKGAGRKTEIPFGPFIALGAMLSFLYGESIIDWYLQSFFSA